MKKKQDGVAELKKTLWDLENMYVALSAVFILSEIFIIAVCTVLCIRMWEIWYYAAAWALAAIALFIINAKAFLWAIEKLEHEMNKLKTEIQSHEPKQ